MGVISRLRENMHFVLYALLAAFLALIVFEWGMDFSGFSGGGTLAGKVNGTPVEYRQYDQLYNRLVDDYRSRAPQAELTDVLERDLHQQAWDMVVDQIILQEQIEKFNIRVADEEILMAVESDDPPMVIRQNFFDAETGAIDRDKLEKARMAPENRDIWIAIEDIIRRELMAEKLQGILQTMAKVTDTELDAFAERQFAVYSASYLVAPYSLAGSDSLFSVSDREVEDYYAENKELFRQEPSRSLDYVAFPAVPTTRDSMTVRTELASLAETFAQATDDSAFVSLQSDRADRFNKRYSRADFSVRAGNEVFAEQNLKAGAIIGPVADRTLYRLLKVKEVSTGEAVARASHILIPFTGNDAAGEQEARETAAGIMRDLRSGTDFAVLAGKYSKDPGSAAEGGDLGWFGRSVMAPEFENAVFGSAIGSIVGPVETRFGLHIIKVTGKDSRRISCSEVVRDIRPSETTLENARRKAAEFQLEAENRGFEKASESFGTEQLTTGAFTKADIIPDIGYNSSIVRFAFSSSKGDISDIFRTSSGFLVMRLARKNDSGYKELDTGLQGAIRAELLVRKKGEKLDARLAGLVKEKTDDLETIAAKLGGIQVTSLDGIRFRENAIPDNNDIRLIEAIVGMDTGEISKPVPVKGGRALIVLHEKAYPDIADLQSEKIKLRPVLEQVKKERFIRDYFAAARREAKIEDLRGF